MRFPALLLLAALPALADTRFQVRRMMRDDVPLGKGQCDIRLQVDNQVEVSLRGDLVTIRTLAGQDARDDGSECNAALPNRDVMNFSFEVRDSRGDIRLLAEPSPRNGWAAVVAIRDGAGGFGRYHFRVSWSMTGADYRGPGRGEPGPVRPLDNVDRGRPGGFSWNNVISFRGVGRGDAYVNDFGPMRLGEATIDIDRGGRVQAWFRTDRGRGMSFTGSVMAREDNRWKAEVTSEDRRYRGPLWFTTDDRGDILTVTIEASDGRDRMQVNWNRR